MQENHRVQDFKSLRREVKMEKRDCFAYSKENATKCNILITKNCAGCRLYKTREQYEEGLRKYP